MRVAAQTRESEAAPRQEDEQEGRPNGKPGRPVPTSGQQPEQQRPVQELRRDDETRYQGSNSPPIPVAPNDRESEQQWERQVRGSHADDRRPPEEGNRVAAPVADV